VAVGERVTASACLVCHECAWCRAARPTSAPLGSLGLCADGALANRRRARVRAAPPARRAVGEIAALSEPAAVAVHACRQARLRGETVAVVGARSGSSSCRWRGPTGGCRLHDRAAGGGWRAGGAACARAALDPAEPADKAIAAATGERRADVVFECTGSTAGIETALRVSGKGGRVVLVGIYRDASPAPWARLQAHEKEIVGTSAYTDDFPEALRLLAGGQIRGDLLISDRIALADVVGRGLRALVEEPARHVKILVRP
jgi:(R,R)-butanediol dehydrogenase/meso-butanediol dehydrogenase/diacetyl reductase